MIADWCVQDENCGDVRELDSSDRPYGEFGALGSTCRIWSSADGGIAAVRGE